jgi:hypothetical protein
MATIDFTTKPLMLLCHIKALAHFYTLIVTGQTKPNTDHDRRQPPKSGLILVWTTTTNKHFWRLHAPCCDFYCRGYKFKVG